MRHRVAHRKLGRTTEHRRALLRNQAEALLRHERISTTVAKAKELRPFVERLITVAKRGVADGAGARVLHARRLVGRDLADREVASKLFETIAPRFATRPGGYTRLLRLGHRQSDSADMAQIELIGSEYTPETDTDAEVEKAEAKPSVGGRLRRAARRIRGADREVGDAGAAPSAKPNRGGNVQPKRTRKKV